MSMLVGDPQCWACRHYRSWVESPAHLRTSTCAAFPEGIPQTIFFGGADHREPYLGDNGVRWESNGKPYPAE
ncbi:hypothetical protein ACQEVZ_28650 [Dactylosporangium sp. CA-152071]|uniref:hypothetical protein n=1 Tax=Dactylosporangium sp. CA-152071 TaxID=3239933 RepID=UPI003D92980D